ncbi:MAG: V4R domain-containing protein [Gemmatimonadota bacterium]
MTPPKELALPGSTLRILRRSLQGEVGRLPTIHALHAAGYRAGLDLAPELHESARPRKLEDLPEEDFWGLLEAFFLRRGWGRLDHRTPHPAVGVLVATDWAEADDEEDERQPTCAFTSGLLSSLLTEVANAPVAVLELRCRSRGDGECHFAFGAEGVIHDLYGSLLEGSNFELALDTL